MGSPTRWPQPAPSHRLRAPVSLFSFRVGKVAPGGITLRPYPPIVLLALCLQIGCHDAGEELDLEQLAAHAIAEDDALFTYGMPDDYGGYREAFRRFEEQYGIQRLDLSMSSTAVLERLAAERLDPQTDLAVVGALSAEQAVEQGLVDCVPLLAAEGYPDEHVHRGENDCVLWMDTFTGTLGFMVNLEVVDDPPESWADLMKPEYAAQVSFLDPRASATGVATLLAAARAMGGGADNPTPGAELLIALLEAGGTDRAMQRQDYDGFLRGTRPILINYDYTEAQLRARFELESAFVIPDDGTVAMPYTTLLVRDRPHPHGGRLAMEYLHGPTGQEALAGGGVTTMLERPGEGAGAGGGKTTKIVRVDRARIGSKLDAIRRAYAREIAPLERKRP